MNNSLLRLRILIVDDIPEHAERLRRKIAHLDHEIVITINPAEAIKVIESRENLYNPVDVAILDYFMPEMDGIQLGMRLKELDADLSIIILTSDCSNETLQSILSSDLDTDT